MAVRVSCALRVNFLGNPRGLWPALLAGFPRIYAISGVHGSRLADGQLRRSTESTLGRCSHLEARQRVNWRCRRCPRSKAATTCLAPKFDHTPFRTPDGV